MRAGEGVMLTGGELGTEKDAKTSGDSFLPCLSPGYLAD